MISTEPPGKGDAWFLTLTRTAGDERTAWRASGRLGEAGSAVLVDTLMPLASTGHRLVLDLARVDYVSGAGIKAIAALAKAARDSGGSLELVSLVESVRICLDLAGPLGGLRAAPLS